VPPQALPWIRNHSPALIALLTAGLAGSPLLATPWMGFLTVRDAQVWPEGRSGNYGTAKYFLDESQNEAIPIDVSVQVYADGNAPGSLDVELFSNINRRDYAKVWESPDQSGGPTSYYMSYPLRYEAQSGDNFVYRTNLTLTKTGAYRLTARFRINHGPWLWHNKFRYGVNQRDCAIVVSPKKALGLTLYEVNPLVATARPGGAFEQRGTLDDFTDTPPVGQTPFNLAYVRNTLGFNTLWIMPIFPITRELWDPNQRKEVANYSPGSPYATRDYWSVNEFLSRSNTPPASLAAFKRVVAEADRMGLNVFIDVALNHAGADVIYGQGAVDLDLAASSQAGLRIRSERSAGRTLLVRCGP
jgi:hypothetical protein